MNRSAPRAAAFPAGFRFGTATSAYQIEGAPLADGKGPSIWDAFTHQPGRVRTGETGDTACDHYARWTDDLDLMRDLGVNAYRFSISWPRVIPAGRGRANAAGLAFYDRLIDGLLERGIEPWATLYHWDLPHVLEENGGWPNRDTAEHFAEFAAVTASALGDRVAAWMTLNEPWVSTLFGYGLGVHAPGRANMSDAVLAGHHQLLGHGLAVRALRASTTGPARDRVGVAAHLAAIHAASGDDGDEFARHLVDALVNRWFLDPMLGRGYPEELSLAFPDAADGLSDAADHAVIAENIDFLGVNYYTRHVARALPDGATPHAFTRPIVQMGVPLDLVPEGQRGSPLTGQGWEVYPRGLGETLERLHREYGVRELVVTENGASYPDRVNADGSVDDADRRAYLEAHLDEVARVAAAGVPVTGYFAWTLMDNFEWNEGTSQRFGLYRTDFATLERRLKASGAWYRDLVRAERGL